MYAITLFTVYKDFFFFFFFFSFLEEKEENALLIVLFLKFSIEIIKLIDELSDILLILDIWTCRRGAGAVVREQKQIKWCLTLMDII